MYRLLTFALLVSAPAVSWAEPFLLDLPTGTHNLKIVVAADGTVTAMPLRVVTVGGRPAPNPQPDPVPNPPPVTAITTAVEGLTKAALASGGSKTSGAAISSIYSLASVEVAEGRLDPLKAFDFTARATETILGFQSDKAKWDSFRTELSRAVLTPLRDAGSLQTKEQVSSVMQQIAAGMDRATGFDSSPKSIAAVLAATPAERAQMGLFDGIDIERILELLRLIMALIAFFKGM